MLERSEHWIVLMKVSKCFFLLLLHERVLLNWANPVLENGYRLQFKISVYKLVLLFPIAVLCTVLDCKTFLLYWYYRNSLRCCTPLKTTFTSRDLKIYFNCYYIKLKPLFQIRLLNFHHKLIWIHLLKMLKKDGQSKIVTKTKKKVQSN